MVRYAFLAVFLGLFVACSQAEDSGYIDTKQAQTGATGASSSSGGTGGSSSSASSGAGGASLAVCDDAAACGDFVSGCTGCAVADVCAEVYNGCFGDAACLDFNKCLTKCNSDAACIDQCGQTNAVGKARYEDLVTCIVCQVCPKSCADFASFCP